MSALPRRSHCSPLTNVIVPHVGMAAMQLQLSETNIAALNRVHRQQTTMDSVLVIGAGELGMAVLEALAAHPKHTHVRASCLLRQATLDSAAPAKQKTIQRLHELKVHFEAADVTIASVDDLAAIFSKYHTVVSYVNHKI